MPPAGGGGGRPVLFSLVRMQLAEALRPGRNAQGVQAHPLRQIAGSMAMLGVLQAYAMRSLPAASRIQALALACGLITAFLALPDPAEEFARRRDILGHLPIPPSTATLARFGFLVAVLTLVVLPLSLPSLLWIGYGGGLSPLRLVAVVPALLLLASAGTFVWLIFAFTSGRWLGIKGIRRLGSLLVMLTTLGVALVGTFPLLGFEIGSNNALAIAASLAPTSWFVNWLLPGAVRGDGLAFAAAMAVVVLAAAGLSKTRPDLLYERESRGTGADRDDLSARAGRRLPGSLPVRGLTLFLVRVLGREPILQMRQRANLLSFAAIWAFSFFARDLPLTFGALIAFACITLAGAASDVSRTTQTDASWAIVSAPLTATEKTAAMRRTVHLRSTLLLVPLLGIWAVFSAGVTAGLVHLLGVGSVSYFLVACGLALRPRQPLSDSLSAPGGLGAFFVSLPYIFGGVVLWAPFALVLEWSAAAALLLAAWGASVLCGMATLLELVAARRLEAQ